MIRTVGLLVVLASVPGALAQPAVEGPLDRVLGAVVDAEGRVDYARLARDRAADLDAALAAVAATDPATLRSDAQKTAFLANAYNAHVLRRVLQTGARHLEREDLFADMFERPVRVAGVSMTLDQLEHGVLRRQDRVGGRAVPRGLRALRPSRLDPRIHAALNCAAVSCPPLPRRALRASSLDRDLDRAFAAFLASSRAARVEGGRVVLSSLFDWFADDFAGGDRLGDALVRLLRDHPEGPALRARLAGRTADALRRDRAVRFAYDWTVNRR